MQRANINVPPLKVIQSLIKTFNDSMKTLGPFEKNPHIAVAVSGGIDSLALTFLAEDWVHKQKGKLTLFHVNHGLRKTSAEEAQKVSEWMESRGHIVHILNWNPTQKPSTRIQERARHARYMLLDHACQEHNILHLLTGHHKDDDVETFLMRKEKKSSDYGLAGISRLTYLTHCRLLRPLLSVTKESLVTVVNEHPHIEDPSNKNVAFKRAALRKKNLPHPNMASFKIKRQEDEACAISFLAKNLALSPFGYATLPLNHKADESITNVQKQLALSFVIRHIGQTDYLPRFEAVQGALGAKNTCSVGGTVIYKYQDKMWVAPDIRLLPKTMLKKGTHFVWNRYTVQVDHLTTISPLGEKGWTQVKPHTKSDLPHFILKTLPVFWKGEAVYCIPFLQFRNTQNQLEIQYTPKKSILAEFFV